MRLYGEVTHDRKDAGWIVAAEPQVALRLKRVFRSVGRGDQGPICISDTLENARDLAWFLDRYPMRISDADRKLLRKRSMDHMRHVEDVTRVLGSEYAPTKVALAIPLRHYQEIAVELANRTRGLLLADDVGVGKTACGIGLLANPAARPALVTTMTHLPKQWEEEINRFLPGMRIHILSSSSPYSFADRKHTGHDLPDVIISNYHKLNGWAGELAGKIKTVIFDECHELRRNVSQKYAAAKMIAAKAEYRLGLTATPIFNYGGEFFNVADVLSPGTLGTWTEFSTEWCNSDGDRARSIIADTQAFGSYVREIGLMLRRTRHDVNRELPGLTVCPHTIESNTLELDRIGGDAAKLAKIILAQGGTGFDKLRASEEFSWRLRQATGISKAPFVADFVRLLVESGESVLLAGWHREVYSLWKGLLAHTNPVFFTGTESPTEKEKSKQTFLRGDSKVLIMSLRAGAGIDGLQKICRNVVFGEIDWSPAVHEQFTGRVYRDGQIDPVMAYYLLTDSGSDPVIADVLGIKRAQLEGIRDPSADVLTTNQTDPDRIKRLAEDYLLRHASWNPPS